MFCLNSMLNIIFVSIFFVTCVQALPIYKTDLYRKREHVKLVQDIKNHFRQDITSFVRKINSSEENGPNVGMRCTACTMWVNYELWKAKSYSPNDDHSKIQYWLEAGCEYFKVEAPEVCQGSIKIFGPEVVQVLTRITLSAEEICGISMPDICPIHYINNSGLSSWKVDIPSNFKQHRNMLVKPRTTLTIKVLHISDVHVDTEYKIGGNANCDEPICCRDLGKNHVTIVNPLTGEKIKSNPHDTFRPAGVWGDYHSCDLPIWTLENLFQKLGSRKGEIYQKFDYVIWTGDIPAHDVWAQSRAKMIDLTFKLTKMFLKYFPGIPVYPSVGNHDSFPSNNFPPSGLNVDKKYSVTWLYDALAKAWSPWIPKEELKNVRKGGFYTVLVKPGFRIISLNTNLCYTLNWWIWLKPHDPGGMLQWFTNVLTEAEQKGEKVQVIGHVPPGREPECFKTWTTNYIRIITRFRDTISGQFFGHTHFDEFQVFYSNNQPMSVAYLAPSVTPYVAVNPAYRVYDVDGFYTNSTWSVLNHQTYSLDLNKANLVNKTDWRLEYDALKNYNLKDLTAKSWGKLLKSWIEFLDNESQNATVPKSLQNYLRYYVHDFTLRSSEVIPGQLNCDTKDCIKNIVCDIGKGIHFPVCAKTTSNKDEPIAPTTDSLKPYHNYSFKKLTIC